MRSRGGRNRELLQEFGETIERVAKRVEARLGEYSCRGDIEGKSQSFAYLRPNLLYTRKFVIVHSTFSASSEE